VSKAQGTRAERATASLAAPRRMHSMTIPGFDEHRHWDDPVRDASVNITAEPPATFLDAEATKMFEEK
jgi:hypothetical protein